MSPHDAIIHFLDTMARPAEAVGVDPPEAELALPEGVLHLELATCDRLACSFHCLTLRSTRLAGLASEQLRGVCDQLARRLDYLLEPMRLIELDDSTGTAQMRSDPPRTGKSGSTFYEVAVRRGGEISLRRYHAPAGQQRQPVPATVTSEVLGHLADDLVAALPG